MQRTYLHWRELWHCRPTPGWWTLWSWRSVGKYCLSWAAFPQSPAGSVVCNTQACMGPHLDRAHPEPPRWKQIKSYIKKKKMLQNDNISMKLILTSSRSKRMNSSPDTRVRKSVRWSWLQTKAFLLKDISSSLVTVFKNSHWHKNKDISEGKNWSCAYLK